MSRASEKVCSVHEPWRGNTGPAACSRSWASVNHVTSSPSPSSPAPRRCTTVVTRVKPRVTGRSRRSSSYDSTSSGTPAKRFHRLSAMDFDLTDEQRLIQQTVRSFVDERVLPNAIENDINHHL